MTAIESNYLPDRLVWVHNYPMNYQTLFQKLLFEIHIFFLFKWCNIKVNLKIFKKTLTNPKIYVIYNWVKKGDDLSWSYLNCVYHGKNNKICLIYLSLFVLWYFWLFQFIVMKNFNQFYFLINFFCKFYVNNMLTNILAWYLNELWNNKILKPVLVICWIWLK